ncbi:hypothetical protein ACH5RR_035430 [Cinchona calisaya]|uniref:Uncharacterized protein n=1 Tax=Cinchona calisaya TaxID=153742 RepID=A0ABD2Y2L2_9GENT
MDKKLLVPNFVNKKFISIRPNNNQSIKINLKYSRLDIRKWSPIFPISTREQTDREKHKEAGQRSTTTFHLPKITNKIKTNHPSSLLELKALRPQTQTQLLPPQFQTSN